MAVLTKTEQRVMGLLSDGSVFTIGFIRVVLGRKRFMAASMLNKVILGLVKKGALTRITRGTYLVFKGNTSFDPYTIAPYLSKGGYIGMESALMLYGYKSAVGRQIDVISSGKSLAQRLINGYRYRLVPMHDLAFGAVQFEGYAVSSKAKTLFDCIYRIKYVNDFGALLSLIRDMKKEDYKEFIEYTSLVNASSFFERCGILLKAGGAPQRIMQRMKSRIGKPVVIRLKPNLESRGAYSKEWSVYDNIGLERLRRW